MAPGSGGNDRTEEIQTQVRAWLVEEGWQVQPLGGPEVSWGFSARDSMGRGIAVLQMSDHRDRIVIQTAIEVSEGHQQRIAGLPQNERISFLWEMQIRLMQIGVLFTGVSDPLQRIVLAQRIYYDALTKDAFLQRVSHVLNGLLVVLGTISQKFAEPPRGIPGQLMH